MHETLHETMLTRFFFRGQVLHNLVFYLWLHDLMTGRLFAASFFEPL
jgi:hypothetical protein